MDRAEREFRGTDRVDDEVGVPAPSAPVLLRDAIVGYYLETGDAIDAPGLAERVGWSVSRVRRVIVKCHGLPGTSVRKEVLRGSRECWVYRPSLEHLATIVKNLQQRVRELEEKASDFSDLPNGERWW